MSAWCLQQERGPVRNRAVRGAVRSLWSPSVWKSSSGFDLPDLDALEDDGPAVLSNVLPLRLVPSSWFDSMCALWDCPRSDAATFSLRLRDWHLVG